MFTRKAMMGTSVGLPASLVVALPAANADPRSSAWLCVSLRR